MKKPYIQALEKCVIASSSSLTPFGLAQAAHILVGEEEKKKRYDNQRQLTRKREKYFG